VQNSGKKTLDTQAVFAALETLEFPDWKERLEAELASAVSSSAPLSLY
jgi:hypothetical protein